MSGAKAAVGTKFYVGTYQVLLLKSIGGLDLTADTIDVTCLDSTGGWREFIAGFKDAGEVPLSGYFDSSAGQDELYDAFIAGTITSCKIEFPSTISANWTFDGVVTKFGTSAESEGAIEFNGTVKVSGQPTLNG